MHSDCVKIIRNYSEQISKLLPHRQFRNYDDRFLLMEIAYNQCD